MHSSAVKLEALSLGLTVFQPTNLKADEFYNQISELKADLAVVIAFRMLPERIWSAPRLGTINLHGSLLPKYRGAAPIQHAIIQGEHKTGLTVFFLRHEIDTGDIVATVEVPILDSDNFGSLHDKMMRIGAQLICESLHTIAGGNYKLMPQDAIGTASFAPKITREFCEITSNYTSEDLYNKIRGLSPFPGAWIDTKFGIMKIYGLVRSNQISVNEENIQIIGRSLFLKSLDGMLEITSLQLSGKPKISGIDFVNGQKSR